MSVNKKPHLRTSQIWTIQKQKLQNILNESKTYKEVFQKIGIFSSSSGSSYNQRLRERCKQDNIDIKNFQHNREKFMKQENFLKAVKNNKISDQLVFCENSKLDRQKIKNRIIKNKLIHYSCQQCPVVNTYNNKPISLQLDHINGVNDDNRLQNLRFLCPNCHSQTQNYAGKANKIKNFCSCGNPINKNSTSCRKCSQQNKQKLFNPDKEQFIQKLKQLDWNWTKLGKFYSVSDNTVKNRANEFNLESPYKNITRKRIN